jgi:pimeloyl-ACP methyl ester carboxylesterase
MIVVWLTLYDLPISVRLCPWTVRRSIASWTCRGVNFSLRPSRRARRRRPEVLIPVQPQAESDWGHRRSNRGARPMTGAPSKADQLRPTLARPVIAVGFSIGCSMAAYLGQQRPLTGIVLVTPFDSLDALARERYWWTPVRVLLRHQMPTIEFIRRTSLPTAFIAAGRDAVVPFSRSEPLRLAIPNLVFDRTFADAGHNDLYDHPAFNGSMHEALARIEAAARKPVG